MNSKNDSETENVLPIEELPDVGAPLPMDDIQVLNPDENDIMEEVQQLDAFIEYQRRNRWDTFGD